MPIKDLKISAFLTEKQFLISIKPDYQPLFRKEVRTSRQDSRDRPKRA